MPTQKDFLLYHHMGLGDFVMCNGLVRKLYDTLPFENFYLMTKDVFMDQVQFMFRDLDRLICLEAPDDTWDCPTQWVPHQMFDAFPGIKLKLFMWHLQPRIVMPPPDEMDDIGEHYWYKCLGFDSEVAYEYFHLERDYDREQQVYDEVIGDSQEPYVFVADDPGRGYSIDLAKANHHDFKAVRSSDLMQYTIFDLLGIAERAYSCHVMWSNLFHVMNFLNGVVPDECDVEELLFPLYLHESYLNKIGHFDSSANANVRRLHEEFLKKRNVVFV